MNTGEWDISVCGLNCACCDVRARDECGGCRGPKDHHCSPQCEFVRCARAKGHTWCFGCAEFPCDEVQVFAADRYEHHRLAVENAKQMKAMGVEAWVASQPRVMFCPGWIT